MNPTRTLILTALFALTACSASLRAHADGEIGIEPAAPKPGQTVTLKWYFAADSLIVSGGKFGKGTVVTGKTSLTDAPKVPTRYTFDVVYRAPATDTTPEKQVKARYTVVAAVNGLYPVTPPPAGLQMYKASRGWQVGYLPLWKHDHVNTPDEGRDGLVYFQKEDDSVERMAVAVMQTPIKDAAELIQQVKADIPSRYDKLVYLAESYVPFQDTLARRCVFEGADTSHPGTRTTTELICFVRDGRGFVISTRCEAARYKTRQVVLQKMLQSFALTNRMVIAPRVVTTSLNKPTVKPTSTTVGVTKMP